MSVLVVAVLQATFLVFLIFTVAAYAILGGAPGHRADAGPPWPQPGRAVRDVPAAR